MFGPNGNDPRKAATAIGPYRNDPHNAAWQSNSGHLCHCTNKKNRFKVHLSKPTSWRAPRTWVGCALLCFIDLRLTRIQLDAPVARESSRERWTLRIVMTCQGFLSLRFRPTVYQNNIGYKA